jgi:hypothetical protein
MSSVERKSNWRKNLDTLQIAFRRISPSTQANAGRIATAGYHSENTAITHIEDQMAEAIIGALSDLATATATAADGGVVAALTQANSVELRELGALLHKERRDKRGQTTFNPSQSNYCWTHGYKVGSTHTSLICKLPKPGHKSESTRADNMGGSQAKRE